MENTPQMTPARDYKSRLFTMIFSDRKKLLELYNAVSGKNYEDPELLTINTLENAIYMSMKNDLSFLIDSRLSLYEHQSTYNPNMALRFLLYLADIYSPMIKGKNVYGSKLIQIPPPKFLVFYNGREERPTHEVLYLSDAYMVQDSDISLEMKVDVFNINRDQNCEFFDTSKTLRDYSEYVWRVRKYAEKMPVEEAVERAINECIREDILKEFLEANRAEAKAVSIYEYDEEEHIRMEREDYFERGREAGIKEEQKNTAREKERADTEKERADTEKERADTEKERADTEKQRADAAEQELQKVREELERIKNKPR